MVWIPNGRYFHIKDITRIARVRCGDRDLEDLGIVLYEEWTCRRWQEHEMPAARFDREFRWKDALER